ncbi:hypothetical protein E2P81_ATG07571 [Venturia nashicola]|uniref:Uncharacterized protein n=1 Tax=Venturia nashicola TaxID=86259 RepID=A0A4Z1P6Y6_9PEZI|nr:hypothetical protein E6O75_ATG07730 [Venturia nashicola]TLD32081.1 hypothetical protein E2P81_ATG07571 [Venturia nashicola]
MYDVMEYVQPCTTLLLPILFSIHVQPRKSSKSWAQYQFKQINNSVVRLLLTIVRHLRSCLKLLPPRVLLPVLQQQCRDFMIRLATTADERTVLLLLLLYDADLVPADERTVLLLLLLYDADLVQADERTVQQMPSVEIDILVASNLT